MPELPEVETIRSGLAPYLAGRTATSIEVAHPRAARRHVGGPSDLENRLRGKRFESVDRRGKYLWITGADATDEVAVVVHLGMSGQLLISEADAPDPVHLRIRVQLDDGRQLRFVDQRTFGGWHVDELVTVGERALPESVAHIAPDPFEPAYDPDRVVSVLRKRDTEIKRAILDQTVVSGIGNIYADESLWRAQLHGRRRTRGITRAALGELLGAASDVMGEAIKVGGTSFDDLYVNVNGQSGTPVMERNVPGRSLPLRTHRSLYFGGACPRPLSPSVLLLPAKTSVEARLAAGRGHVNRCSFGSLRPTARQFGQRRPRARGIELDRAAQMSAPGMVVHRHGVGLRTLRGEVHA